jgi:hypothetical protein
MKTPDISCKIEAFCSICPSEDPNKVKQAITNILDSVDIKINQETIRATSTNLESLKKIYESIHTHKTQNTYSRQLNLNLENESTWFYLNKQAAFANTISICSESDESPLGPIKITLDSKNIVQILDWLIATK